MLCVAGRQMQAGAQDDRQALSTQHGCGSTARQRHTFGPHHRSAHAWQHAQQHGQHALLGCKHCRLSMCCSALTATRGVRGRLGPCPAATAHPAPCSCPSTSPARCLRAQRQQASSRMGVRVWLPLGCPRRALHPHAPRHHKQTPRCSPNIRPSPTCFALGRLFPRAPLAAGGCRAAAAVRRARLRARLARARRLCGRHH